MKHSYTSTSDFQICKARYFHKHVAKDAPFESTPQLEYGRRVHDAFRDYFNAGRLLPEDLAYLEPFARSVLGACKQNGLKLLVEQRLGIRADGSPCGFYDDDRAWAAIADVALLNEQTCAIFDWKTGKEREDPFELRIQAVLICAHHPSLQTFKGRYVWLKQNKVGESHNLSDVKRTWAEMRSIGEMIEQHEKLNHWPEQEGPLCAWCPAKMCRFNRTADASAAVR